MNKIKQYFTIFLLFFLIFILFKYNYILAKSVIDSINLWVYKIFPSLFIMFILSDIIIELNLVKDITTPIKKIFNHIFKLSYASSETFILAIFSGTPTNAFIISEMLNNGKITSNDANKLIAFTYFSNPLFLYNVLSISFSKYIVFKIIIIHYLTNIIIGVFFKNYSNNDDILNITSSLNKSKNILYLLPISIKNSMYSLINILGTITFYMIITNLLLKILHLNIFLELIIKGFLELTQFLNSLNLLDAKSILKEILAISFISFGGLSIHTQVLTIISNTKIKYKNFFIGRILHTLISTSTYILITYIGF